MHELVNVVTGHVGARYSLSMKTFRNSACANTTEHLELICVSVFLLSSIREVQTGSEAHPAVCFNRYRDSFLG